MKKTRFCHFSYAHGNFSFTRVSHLTHTWNVTKCHACHAKRHEHIFWHVKKDTFFATFPIGTATSSSQGSRTSHTWNVTKPHACHAKRHDVEKEWKRHVFVTFPMRTATLASRGSRTSHTRGMSQSATHATPNDMSTSSDTSKKTRFCYFSYSHGNFSLTRVAHLTHVECHKVPHLPRKTTWAHLLTRRKRHVFATFPIGTATSASRGSRTSHAWNVTKRQACHAKRNDHIFWHVKKDTFLQLFP